MLGAGHNDPPVAIRNASYVVTSSECFKILMLTFGQAFGDVCFGVRSSRFMLSRNGFSSLANSSKQPKRNFRQPIGYRVVYSYYVVIMVSFKTYVR